MNEYVKQVADELRQQHGIKIDVNDQMVNALILCAINIGYDKGYELGMKLGNLQGLNKGMKDSMKVVENAFLMAEERNAKRTCDGQCNGCHGCG